MTTISLERIVQIETPLFPGEGRGPVTERRGSSVAPYHFGFPDWTPAFAGEAREALARA